jgi:hypothetical protein
MDVCMYVHNLLGDQIIGDCYLRARFENDKSGPNFWATFFPRCMEVMFVLILTKNGLGYILCHFFTNSSGHPG